MFGRTSIRLSDVTASARSLPPLTIEMMLGGVAN
jgi:hypothetical protein